MPSVFLYSDPHFGHFGVCRFTQGDGITPLRPWDHPDEMDEAMVKLYNETVKPNDKVYFLGDVVINRRALPTLGRLNGEKILLKGNHDVFRLEEYTPYFRDIRSYHVMNGAILSHIPVHESQMGRFGTNIHGHLHSGRVMTTNQYHQSVVDTRYHCVCVEQTDFKPILVEDVFKRILAEGGSVGKTQGNR